MISGFRFLLVCAFTAFIMFANSRAETVCLKGRIITDEGEPLSSVHILNHSDKTNAFSRSDGSFEICLKKSSSYKLHISHIGYETLDTVLSAQGVEAAGLVFEMKQHSVTTKGVVVTGTKSPKEIENNPIPTTLIGQDELKSYGVHRLDDIISEQVGMQIVEDLGRGVQIQGLSESYALILINGEPAIGTMKGKLNLNRFATGNLNRIEIVKGPSSSLYGSNALAGVINLITEMPKEPWEINASAKYGTYNVMDFSLETKMKKNDFGMNLFLNHFRGDGYKLKDTKQGLTVPAYKNYTGAAEFFYDFSPMTQISLRSRFNYELQENEYPVKTDSSSSILKDYGNLYDANIALSLKHKYTDIGSVTAKIYGTIYQTKSDLNTEESAQQLDYNNFEQSYMKGEILSDYVFIKEHYVMLGLGMNLENVNSEIISAQAHNTKSYYIFLQDDWGPVRNVNLIASLRYDSHSDYESHWSPKIAVSWSPFSSFTVRGSIGNGFKAPTSEELYLNWTNPTSGYSVFGAAYLRDGLTALKEKGLIDTILIPLDNLSPLTPESSWSYNLGANYDVNEDITARLNLFQNQVDGMIEFINVAVKSNGKYLISYLNLNSAFTYGLESEVSIRFLQNFIVSIGYQYLTSGDDEVLSKIRSGKIFKIGSTGRLRPVQDVEYGGLFNRSKHSGKISLSYFEPNLNIDAVLRGTLRSRYGWADKNSNSILDDDSEYAPGYGLWNFTISKNLWDYFTLQAGINNIFDRTDPIYMQFTPGRTFFINLNFKFVPVL